MGVLWSTTHQTKIIVVCDEELPVEELSCDQSYVFVSLRPLHRFMLTDLVIGDLSAEADKKICLQSADELALKRLVIFVAKEHCARH